MGAMTAQQKARLFDLFSGVMELVREGKRNPEDVARALQGIKNAPSILPTKNKKTNVIFHASTTFFNPSSGVKMVQHGDNFTSWFSGKVERNPPKANLASLTLERDMYDSEIIKRLGGKAKAEVTLSEVWDMMSIQPNGEEGQLFTNGYASIFYVRDASGFLRTVYVDWWGDGWLACALELGGYGWSGGFQVFSRNSCLSLDVRNP